MGLAVITDESRLCHTNFTPRTCRRAKQPIPKKCGSFGARRASRQRWNIAISRLASQAGRDSEASETIIL